MVHAPSDTVFLQTVSPRIWPAVTALGRFKALLAQVTPRWRV